MTEKKKNTSAERSRSIPELRFPEFDEEWEDNLFGSQYKFLPTYSFSRSELNYETGKIKNIHYGDIHTKFNNNFIAEKEDIPFINPSNLPKNIDEDNFCSLGDLIIADASEDYNDVGKSIEIRSLGGIKLLAGLHTFLARPNLNNIAIGFMGYYLQTRYLKIQRMKLATGISVLGISKSNFQNVKIKLPSLPEQQKIASFLTSVDERIQQLTKKKGLLDKYKKGIMQKIFSQELRFKDDDGNDYPDWEKKSLKNIASIYDGTHMTPDYQEQGVPFYSVEHVTANQFSESKFISEEVFEKENKRVILEKGDILMTRIGDIGTSKYIDWDIRASFYVSLALLKKKSSIYMRFLDQFIKTSFFQKELYKRTIHVAFPKKINLGEIGECELIYPVIEEQQKIANYLSSIDKKIEAVETQLEKTKEFKKGLLQKMFV